MPISVVSAVIRPDLDHLWLFSALSLITGPLGILGHAATIHAAGQGYSGERVDFRAAYRQAMSRFWSILGAGLLMGAVVTLLSITVIGIPVAIYFAVRWSMSICAVVLEDESATNALSRSTDLVRGGWWRVFGITFVLGLILVGIYILGLISIAIGSALIYIIEYITDAAESNAGTIATLAATVLNILVAGISTIGLTVLFFDLRTRQELSGVQMASTPSPDLP